MMRQELLQQAPIPVDISLVSPPPVKSPRRSGSIGSQFEWLNKTIKRATSLRFNSTPPPRTESWPKSGAQSEAQNWPQPTLAISTLLYEGTLYTISAHRWGPIEVLRKVNAWVDHATFRCMGSNPRVKGLEVPLHLVRAVLPSEQHKRFSICLHDGTVHTFRVVGTNVKDSILAWVDAIGRASTLLQRQLAGARSARVSPNSPALGDGSAVSLGLFPRVGAMSPPALPSPSGLALPGQPGAGSLRPVAQTPQLAIDRPLPRLPAGLPPGLPPDLPPAPQPSPSSTGMRIDLSKLASMENSMVSSENSQEPPLSTGRSMLRV